MNTRKHLQREWSLMLKVKMVETKSVTELGRILVPGNKFAKITIIIGTTHFMGFFHKSTIKIE
jgi:hypothetical protein